MTAQQIIDRLMDESLSEAQVAAMVAELDNATLAAVHAVLEPECPADHVFESQVH